MKNVQIPEKLFVKLCIFHLLGLDGMEEYQKAELLQYIENGLQDKLDAVSRREMYSKYKDTTLSPEERQKARKAYLNAIGMQDDYRWSSLEPPT